MLPEPALVGPVGRAASGAATRGRWNDSRIPPTVGIPVVPYEFASEQNCLHAVVALGVADTQWPAGDRTTSFGLRLGQSHHVSPLAEAVETMPWRLGRSLKF